MYTDNVSYVKHMDRASKKFVQKNCYNSLNIKYLTLKICRHLHPSICGGMLVTLLKKKKNYIEILLGIKRPALQLLIYGQCNGNTVFS